MKATDIKQKFTASMDKLIDAIESDEITTDVKAFWDTMSKFHNYSLRNQILIAIQSPNATRVAGYKTWQKMGRQVRKGEHGIGIFAPMKFRKTDTKYADDDPRAFGMAFKGTTVFDVAQTDGEDLPDLTAVEGSEHAAILDRMMTFATNNGITVKWCDTGRAKGSARPSEKLISLSDKIDKNDAVGTLAHELAHIMIDQKSKSYEIGEYEAELSAYLFCGHYDIEIKSPHYLKSWGAERKDLEAALKAVSGFTDKLISGVAA